MDEEESLSIWLSGLMYKAGFSSANARIQSAMASGMEDVLSFLLKSDSLRVFGSYADGWGSFYVRSAADTSVVDAQLEANCQAEHMLAEYKDGHVFFRSGCCSERRSLGDSPKCHGGKPRLTTESPCRQLACGSAHDAASRDAIVMQTSTDIQRPVFHHRQVSYQRVLSDIGLKTWRNIAKKPAVHYMLDENFRWKKWQTGQPPKSSSRAYLAGNSRRNDGRAAELRRPRA
uniref:UBA domain-containing protein n=1 Tax=Macrostomum lignano TaxID=282301 RepID=A0A1I8F5Y6_9PLAT